MYIHVHVVNVVYIVGGYVLEPYREGVHGYYSVITAYRGCGRTTLHYVRTFVRTQLVYGHLGCSRSSYSTCTYSMFCNYGVSYDNWPIDNDSYD